MLRLFGLVTAVVGLTAIPASASEWQSDYATALNNSRSDNRPLLMVIDEPSDPDHRVSAELLDENTNGTLANYELCHVDASTPYGKKVAEAFKTKQFPYVAFIDKSGSVILHSQTGELSSDQWSELVGKYRTGEKSAPRVATRRTVKTRAVSTPMPSTQNYGNYQQYLPASQARPYCAKCQRGY